MTRAGGRSMERHPSGHTPYHPSGRSGWRRLPATADRRGGFAWRAVWVRPAMTDAPAGARSAPGAAQASEPPARRLPTADQSRRQGGGPRTRSAGVVCVRGCPHARSSRADNLQPAEAGRPAAAGRRRPAECRMLSVPANRSVLTAGQSWPFDARRVQVSKLGGLSRVRPHAPSVVRVRIRIMVDPKQQACKTDAAPAGTADRSFQLGGRGRAVAARSE